MYLSPISPHLLAQSNTAIESVDVWLGKKKSVTVYVKSDIYKTIPKAKKKHLKISINYNGTIEAPINRDDILGN